MYINEHKLNIWYITKSGLKKLVCYTKKSVKGVEMVIES